MLRLHACEIHARQKIAGDTLMAGMRTEWLTRDGLRPGGLLRRAFGTPGGNQSTQTPEQE